MSETGIEVALAVKVARETGIEQVIRACTAAPAAPRRIVGNQ
jgi:hypothetical protein